MIDTSFLQMFTALFAISGPIADIPLFVVATKGQTGAQQRKTALIVAVTYLVAALAVLFAGNAALEFFGVSVPALRLAGMAVVAVIGWKMINAPTVRVVEHETEGAGHVHAASNTRLSQLRAASEMAPAPLSIGITPLGFPIYAGPGVLSLLIAWGNGETPVYMVATFAVLANAVVIFALNALAGPITRLIGAQALLVTEKLFGLIVVAIAVGGIASALLVLFPGLR